MIKRLICKHYAMLDTFKLIDRSFYIFYDQTQSAIGYMEIIGSEVYVGIPAREIDGDYKIYKFKNPTIIHEAWSTDSEIEKYLRKSDKILHKYYRIINRVVDKFCNRYCAINCPRHLYCVFKKAYCEERNEVHNYILKKANKRNLLKRR